jgi:hypothetical protein
VTAIAAAGTVSIAVVGGKLVLWGKLCPGFVDETLQTVSDVAEVALSFEHLLVLFANGSVAAYGCGDGPATRIPYEVRTNRVAAIAAGGSGTSMALLADSQRIVAWGSSQSLNNVPATAQGGVARIACGASHALALLTSNEVVAWGDNTDGELDMPSDLSHGSGGRVRQISAGQFFSVVVLEDNTGSGSRGSDNSTKTREFDR